MINLFYPYIPEQAIIALSEVLKTRWIGQGPKVDEFEKLFKEKFNVLYPISLNSGSSALETAFELVGITNGDEVITTPLTCTATNIPLLRLGAKIVWADIKESTLCLDVNDVKKKITSRTKAIVNVHLGGIENDLGELPVPIISDACQALGVFSGDYTCCSFQAIKHITTGDGGMLICPNEQDYKKAKLLRWFGIDREKKKENDWQAYKERKMVFDIEVCGYKRQMTDIDAVLGIEGLKLYNYIIAYRKILFDLYKELLKDIDGIKIVSGKNNTYWTLTVLVERRNNFSDMLFKHGIDNNMIQIRNDIYKVFGGKKQNLPIMNYVEDKYISLPLNMRVTVNDVEYICKVVKRGW